jgi:hypothetical protein
MVQVVEILPSKCEAKVKIPILEKIKKERKTEF